jgi:anhydro-N-acetylmuramic acid kinase
MSGTSLDGVDALLLEVHGSDPATLSWEVRGFRTEAYSAEERERIARAIAGGGMREIALLRRDLGVRFADAFRRLLEEINVGRSEVAAVGSHGQTVWHEPPTEGGLGTTLQIGDPAILAEELGVPVISDFRSADMAAGGEGAPLVPWCDWVLLRRPGVGRALQNLGGMGNVTYLSREGRVEDVLGFDTGPGVALLDAAVRHATSGKESFDRDGVRAPSGKVLPELLNTLLDDPFFRMSPPRSTGRERFGDRRLSTIVETLAPNSPSDWDDLLATLSAFTARSVASAYRDHLPRGEVDEVVLTGGGARNPALVAAIAAALSPLPVLLGTEALGIDPDAREAAAFALLAWAHIERVPGNLPRVTGARGRRVLGVLTPAGGGGV